MKPNIEILTARLDVQTIVLQELARVLKPAQAAAVADAVRARVAELARRDLSHAADAAVAGELVLLLDALTARQAYAGAGQRPGQLAVNAEAETCGRPANACLLPCPSKTLDTRAPRTSVIVNKTPFALTALDRLARPGVSMPYPKPKSVALSLVALYEAITRTGKRPPVVRLTHDEFRQLAGRPGAMRTQVSRSIETHLAKFRLHLFRSKDFYVLAPWGEPSTWRVPTTGALARFVAKQKVCNPAPTQSTNIKGNAKIREVLQAGNAVEVYALPDNSLLRYGGFHVNLVAGLEDSIVRDLNPPWNRLGTM